MKPAIILCMVAVLAGAGALIYLDHEASTGRSSPPPAGKSRPRLPEPDAPFWTSARVEQPGKFREPGSVDPAALGISPAIPQVDHPARVARLLDEGHGDDLQAAVAEWFDADPLAARAWLAARDSLDSFQPALARISCRIAGAGDPRHALEWANLLQPGSGKEQALFDIYALASRNHLFTAAELKAAPLPPERIEMLLGGAAGD